MLRTICGRSTFSQVKLAAGSEAWIVALFDKHARYAIDPTAARRFDRAGGGEGDGDRPPDHPSVVATHHPQIRGEFVCYQRTFKSSVPTTAPHAPSSSCNNRVPCSAGSTTTNGCTPRRGRRTQTEAHWVLPKVGAGDELPGRRKSGPQILRLSTAGSVNCHTNKPAADWSTPLGRSPSGRPSRIVGPWSVRSSLC